MSSDADKDDKAETTADVVQEALKSAPPRWKWLTAIISSIMLFFGSLGIGVSDFVETRASAQEWRAEHVKEQGEQERKVKKTLEDIDEKFEEILCTIKKREYEFGVCLPKDSE